MPSAAQYHDAMNMLCLPALCVLNALNWSFDIDAWWQLEPSRYESWASLWVGGWFTVFFTATVGYVVLDALFVLAFPSSVKAAGTIVAHHIAVLVGLLVPYWRPATHGYALGLCMSVEFQTSILITRRLLIGATFPGAAALRAVVRVVFYMSWLSIRCMLYPWLAIVVFPPDYLADVEKHGTYFTVLLIEPILCLGLTLLNAQWSYELFTGLYKRRLAPDDKAHFL